MIEWFGVTTITAFIGPKSTGPLLDVEKYSQENSGRRKLAPSLGAHARLPFRAQSTSSTRIVFAAHNWRS
eukprot:1186062-Prorocentrum_minimum.AAC.10